MINLPCPCDPLSRNTLPQPPFIRHFQRKGSTGPWPSRFRVLFLFPNLFFLSLEHFFCSLTDKMIDLSRLTASTPIPLLGEHLPILVISTISCFVLWNLSYRYSRIWLGSKWDDFDGRTKRGWASHTVCKSKLLQCHRLLIATLPLSYTVELRTYHWCQQ